MLCPRFSLHFHFRMFNYNIKNFLIKIMYVYLLFVINSVVSRYLEARMAIIALCRTILWCNGMLSFFFQSL